MPQQTEANCVPAHRRWLSTFRRDVLMLLIGAAIGAFFGLLVTYPSVIQNSRQSE